MKVGSPVRLFFRRLVEPVESFFRKTAPYLSFRNHKEFAGVSDCRINNAQDPVSLIFFKGPEFFADGGRYLASLVVSLNDAGHEVFLNRELWIYRQLLRKKFTKDLLDGGQVKFTSERDFMHLERSSFVWTEAADVAIKVSGKYLHLVRTSKVEDLEALWYPYPKFPENLRVSERDESADLGHRKFKVLFSGSLNPSYDSASLKEHGVMTRPVVLEHLIDSSLPRRFYETLGSSSSSCEELLLPAYRRDERLGEGRVLNEEYLAVLGLTDFFICAPGRSMPFSHNVVEAMGCGAIPILQYGDYFSPKLEGGKNCLVFHDRQSLIEVVGKAMQMDESAIAKMRASVRSYYSENLRFEGFLQRLSSSPQRQCTVYYYS